MNLPISFEVEVSQQDFIQLEILEKTQDLINDKKDYKKTIFFQSLFSVLAVGLIYSISDISNTAIIFPIFFEVLFLLNFLYNYFYGLQNDYTMSIKHLIASDRNGNTFFIDEKGILTFEKETCEYFTNQERRTFSYDKVKHIKETKRAFIFVLKPLKDKTVRNFLYMVVPKRCMPNIDELRLFFDEISKEYNITSWVDCPILD